MAIRNFNEYKRMITRYLTSCLIFCNVFFGFCKNVEPKISNLKAKINSNGKTITLSYDLYDSENDDICVDFNIKSTTEPLEYLSAYGDFGYPIKSGKNLSIIIHYKGTIETINKYVVSLSADDITSLDISVLSTSDLKYNLEFIYGIRHFDKNPDHLEKVRQFICQEFSREGLKPYRQEFHLFYNNGSVRFKKPSSENEIPKNTRIIEAANIIGRLEGIGNSEEMVVLGAHFDTVDSSMGADDNASGVSALIECLQVLSQYSFEKTILFVAFDQEESGMLGSEYFVNKLGIDVKNVHTYINLDMIGYYDESKNSQIFPSELKTVFPQAYKKVKENDFRGNFILNTSNKNSQNLMNVFDSNALKFSDSLNVVSILVPNDGKFASDEFRASDHVAFWDADIPSITLGDTGNFRNKNYHSLRDTLGSVNLNFLKFVTKAVISTLVDIAEIKHTTKQSCVIE